MSVSEMATSCETCCDFGCDADHGENPCCRSLTDLWAPEPGRGTLPRNKQQCGRFTLCPHAD